MVRRWTILLVFLSFTLLSFQSKEEAKSVKEIVSFIEDLYEITTAYKIDSVAGNGDLKAHYQYLSFAFYVYKDEASARTRFDQFVRIAQRDTTLENADPDKFYHTFSKAGSTYILYGSMIIHHDRRCNYNELIEIPREAKLVAYLFDNNPPTDQYFIRVFCGWTKAEIK